jgi:hypothetical protein
MSGSPHSVQRPLKLSCLRNLPLPLRARVWPSSQVIITNSRESEIEPESADTCRRVAFHLRGGIDRSTGASSGIGRAAAIALGQAGWKLALSGRREAELEETARLAHAPDYLVVPGDLGVPENVRELFRRSQDKYGQPAPDPDPVILGQVD